MLTMIKVNDWSQVEKNIIEFNLNLNADSKARRRFAMFSHWYYHPGFDLFAPSKFIGYQETTQSNYSGLGDGGETQEALKPFFEPIEYDTEKYYHYLHKLSEFALANSRSISEKTRKGNDGCIYLPKQEFTIKEEAKSLIQTDETLDLDYIEVRDGKEGKKEIVQLMRSQRDSRLRRVAIAYHGCKCMVCNFDFEKAYGEYGKGYIEVHHLVPLSSSEGERVINPVTDMIVLCSNCHRMAHHVKDRILSLEELRYISRAKINY